MARPYSMDLRERVVWAVERDGLSRRQSGRSVWNRPQDGDRLGSAVSRDGQHGGQADGWLPAEEDHGQYREWLLQRCRAQEFTLRGLVAELAERGLQVDYRTVWEFVHAEKLSYKKRR
jgi:putative transposase